MRNLRGLWSTPRPARSLPSLVDATNQAPPTRRLGLAPAQIVRLPRFEGNCRGRQAKARSVYLPQRQRRPESPVPGRHGMEVSRREPRDPGAPQARDDIAVSLRVACVVLDYRPWRLRH